MYHSFCSVLEMKKCMTITIPIFTFTRPVIIKLYWIPVFVLPNELAMWWECFCFLKYKSVDFFLRVVMAQVRILPEKILSECLAGARPMSQCKCCYLKPVKKREVIQSVAVNRSGNYFTYTPSTRKRKIDRFTAADVTWWPSWVYRQYDVVRFK
jgi:hypothetical protein